MILRLRLIMGDSRQKIENGCQRVVCEGPCAIEQNPFTATFRTGELDAVAYGEPAFDLSVDADAREAAGIVGRKFLVRHKRRREIRAADLPNLPDPDIGHAGLRSPKAPPPFPFASQRARPILAVKGSR